VTSHRPYLLRALYEWILDNDSTPYIIVNTATPDVAVPVGHAQNDRIVLNISPLSIRNLNIGNERVEFDGRFGGRPFHVSAPIAAVLAIYAKETGAGMAFEPDSAEEGDTSKNAAAAADDEPSQPKQPTAGAHLRVVK
jgi:stringent starvation protein B